MRFLAFLLALLLACPVAADLHDLSEYGDFKRIYFLPAPTDRNVEVRVLLPVGEVDRTGPEGLAHYLEHLVVWSADKVHGEGLRDREMNAWTSPYWTAYWNKSAPDAFESMIRNARAVFEPVDLSQKFMLTERDVVEREFDLRYRGNPTARLFREAYHYLYATHGLGRSVMGTPDSIRQISPQDALAFHAETYNPQDAYLLIYGPISKENVEAQIEQHLTDFPLVKKTDRPIFSPISLPSQATLEFKSSDLKRDQALVLGHAAPPLGMSRRRVWSSILVLEDVLNSELPGGLAKPLYYDDFVVTQISTRILLLPTGDIGFEVYFKPEDGITTQEVIDRVLDVMQDLAKDGLLRETVQAIQDQARSEVRRLERDQARYALTIAQAAILNLGEALDVKAYHYELRRPSVDDVNAVLRSLVESPFTITAIAQTEPSQ